MAIRSARFPFQDQFITAVVPATGVYALWDNDMVIFYGVADEEDGLRGVLTNLKQAIGPTCARRASHFQVEPASRVMTPRERQHQLLREHALETRSYPRCNLPDRLLTLAKRFPVQQCR